MAHAHISRGDSQNTSTQAQTPRRKRAARLLAVLALSGTLTASAVFGFTATSTSNPDGLGGPGVIDTNSPAPYGLGGPGVIYVAGPNIAGLGGPGVI